SPKKSSPLGAIVAVLVALAFVGVIAYEATGFGPKSAAKAAVVAQLKDPDSVQFRDLVVGTKSGRVCGEFNAKNSFGAYVGYKWFEWDETTGEVQVLDLVAPGTALGNASKSARMVACDY